MCTLSHEAVPRSPLFINNTRLRYPVSRTGLALPLATSSQQPRGPIVSSWGSRPLHPVEAPFWESGSSWQCSPPLSAPGLSWWRPDLCEAMLGPGVGGCWASAFCPWTYFLPFLSFFLFLYIKQHMFCQRFCSEGGGLHSTSRNRNHLSSWS